MEFIVGFYATPKGYECSRIHVVSADTKLPLCAELVGERVFNFISGSLTYATCPNCAAAMKIPGWRKEVRIV